MPIQSSSSSAAPGRNAGSLPPVFRQIQRWTLLFFAASVCFHLVEFFLLHHHAHSVYPFSLNAHDRFYDFTIFTDKFRYVHTARFFSVGFPINYPAPVALVFAFFFHYAAPHATRAFVGFCVLSFVIPAALFGSALVRRGISPKRAYLFTSILCLFSWPAELIVDGANAEVLVWVALALAMTSLATNHSYLAALLFGLAAALKLFPFVFLALFLRPRYWTQLITGIGSFLAISWLSLKGLGPTVDVAYRGIIFGLNEFKRNYMARWLPGENGVDHSVFASIKFVLHYGFHHNVDDFTGWLRVYLLFTTVGGILLFFTVIRRTPLLNQILLLSIASIYFTAFSGDGTLIHLYYPFAMLLFLALHAWRANVVVSGLSPALACILFCVSVESFFVISRGLTSIRFIGPMHALALGLLFLLALRFPFGPPISQTSDLGELADPQLTWLDPPAKSNS